MKDAINIISGIVLIIIGMMAILYSVRLFTNVSTPITVHQVKPGISCATMTTGDGVAISCWKD